LKVYPTTLRAIGLGAASGFARLGAIVTPFVAQVSLGNVASDRMMAIVIGLLQVAADTSLNIPIAVYGAAGVLGVIASLLLPIETKGRGMKVSMSLQLS
jgi:hypothetical protein